MYRLKKGQEAFQVVDGPFAKRRYRHGVEYMDADVPPQEKHRFEALKTPKTTADLPRKHESTKIRKETL